LPFNIASYGLLLHLLAKETGFGEGRLVGFLGDTHIYENHIEGLGKQLSRVPKDLPNIETENFTSIFDWEYTDSKVIGYEPHGQINFGKPAI
jgi:thymidylate synthase